MIGNPLREATIDDLDRYTWPDPYDHARIRGLEEEVKYWYEHTDYAMVVGFPCGGMFESFTWL